MRKFLSVSLSQRRKLFALQPEQDKQRRYEHERYSEGDQHAALKGYSTFTAEEQELQGKRQNQARERAAYGQSGHLNPIETRKFDEFA